jgi:hypothetical protein
MDVFIFCCMHRPFACDYSRNSRGIKDGGKVRGTSKGAERNVMKGEKRRIGGKDKQCRYRITTTLLSSLSWAAALLQQHNSVPSYSDPWIQDHYLSLFGIALAPQSCPNLKKEYLAQPTSRSRGTGKRMRSECTPSLSAISTILCTE